MPPLPQQSNTPPPQAPLQQQGQFAPDPGALKGLLDPVQVENSVKHQAWNEWYGASSPEDFKTRFDKLNLPNATKHALWNLKYAPPANTLQEAQKAVGMMAPMPGMFGAGPTSIPQTPEQEQVEVGKAIPDWAVSPLGFLTHKAVEPYERYKQATSEWGAKQFEAGATGEGHPFIQQMRERAVGHKPTPSEIGVARGIGSAVTGTVADPLNWPFFASGQARPILQKLISGGFGLQMGAGALQGAQQLYQHWDDMSPQNRSELATQTGLNAIFASLAAMHGFGGEAKPEAAVMSDANRQATPAAATPSKPVAPDIERLKSLGGLKTQGGQLGIEGGPGPITRPGQSAAGQRGTGALSGGQRAETTAIAPQEPTVGTVTPKPATTQVGEETPLDQAIRLRGAQAVETPAERAVREHREGPQGQAEETSRRMLQQAGKPPVTFKRAEDTDIARTQPAQTPTAQPAAKLPAQPVPSPQAAPRAAGEPVSKPAGAPGVKETPFDKLADAQRGEPENRMLNIQHSQIAAGVYSNLVEHVGDIIHRMSEMSDKLQGGYEFVKPKVERAIKALESPYGFQREMDQNIRNNSGYLKIDESAAKEKLKQLGESYSKAHEALPVFNETQKIAQDAAIKLGRMNFSGALAALKSLKNILDKGPEAWKQAALAPEPPARPLKSLAGRITEPVETRKAEPATPLAKRPTMPLEAARKILGAEKGPRMTTGEKVSDIEELRKKEGTAEDAAWLAKRSEKLQARAAEEAKRVSGRRTAGEELPGKSETLEQQRRRLAREKPGEQGFIGMGKKTGPIAGEWFEDERERVAQSRRLAEGLDNLQSQRGADELRAVQDLKASKMSRATDETIYHHLEDPTLPLNPEQRARYDAEIAPLQSEADRAYEKLKERGVPIENYVHRIALAKGAPQEMAALGRGRYSAGAVLRKGASGLKQRTMFSLEHPSVNGKMLVSVKGDRVTVWDNGVPTDVGSRSLLEGAGAKFGQATTKQIESHSPQRYLHSARVSSWSNVLELRRAERASDFLEAYKQHPDFKEVAFKEGTGNPPAGYERTKVEQLRGYMFEKHTAEVLDRYWDKMHKGEPGAFEKMNEFLRTSIFFNPLVHIPNIGVHWAVEKGATGLLPHKWPTIIKTGLRAIDAVAHQNTDFLHALDVGAPLQSHRQTTRELTALMVSKIAKDLETRPQLGQGLAKAFGYTDPRNILRAVYDFSRKATWTVDDVLRLQAAYQHELEQKIPLHEAIKEVGKHIPNYRLPTRIFDSRELGRLMENPGLTMFGPYHYGALKSYGEMAKDLVGKHVPANERARALDRLAALGVITYLIYPAMDQLAQKATGRSDAKMRRAGASTFVDNLGNVLEGKKGLWPAATSVVTPAPLPELAIRGSQTLAKGMPLSEAAKVAGKDVLERVGPIGQTEATRGTIDWKRFFLGLLGVRYAAREKGAGAKLPGLQKLPRLK